MATKRSKPSHHGVRSTSVIHPVIKIDCAAWASDIPSDQVSRGRFRFHSHAQEDAVGRELLRKKKRTSPFQMDPAEAKALVDRLTPREKRVVECTAMGMADLDIAKKLGISAKTIDILRGAIGVKFATNTNGIARIWFCARSA